MQKGRHQEDADPCITEEKEKLIKQKSTDVGVRVPEFWIISVGKEGGRQRVLVRWSHGDKRIGEWSGLTLFQFSREGMLGIGKSRATSKADFGGITIFLFL